MRIFDFFRGQTTMEATTEMSESEINKRLGEIHLESLSPEANTFALGEEKAFLEHKLQAAVAARQSRETKEYRARVTKEADERLARLREILLEIGDLVPRLQMACAGLNRMVDEIHQKGAGFNHSGEMSDLLGVPHEFGTTMLEAIRVAAPDTQWDYGHIGPFPPSDHAEAPKLRKVSVTISPNAFRASGPPPGFSGVWNTLKGRPMEPEEY